MRPMLAVRGDQIPAGMDWAHEVKWDGYRALVEVRGGQVRVTSRTEMDMTDAFPEFEALSGLPEGIVLDGEILALEEGRPILEGIAERFAARGRQARLLAEQRPATLMVFDLLSGLGQSVLDRPLEERRQLLGVLPWDEVRVAQLSPTYDDGHALLRAVRDQGLEGIVSKRRQSRYQPGARSHDWLKFPLRSVASFVVGGYRRERGGSRIGSLLIGEPAEAGLLYRGRVGFSVPALVERAMTEQLLSLRAGSSPFADAPDDGSEWVAPTTVVDVEFLERTTSGRLRHPQYRGQRPDLTVDDIGLGEDDHLDI